ncbi:MAG TPA: tetratricopeptide repeat protein [Caulobacteraceae bacterium]|nr:tetratricopeptide repeat protein [Caulobacteraceae bacterium]
MVDLFDEVEEQLRSDRYRDLVRRAAPIATAVLAAIVIGYLGYWGLKTYQSRNVNAAAVAYQQGVDALGRNDQADAQRNFAAAAKAGAPGYKTLALMQEAGLDLTAGKTADAVSLYDEAAKSAPSPILGDFASLRAAQVLIGTAPFTEVQQRLLPLADAKRPYSLYAREALAMAKLAAGRTAEARRDFSVLSVSIGVPDDMRERCQMAISLIDSGEAGIAVDAAKIAATLPPPPPASVASPPPGTQGQGGPVAKPSGVAQ